jgi:hypothetical protein
MTATLNSLGPSTGVGCMSSRSPLA